MVSIFDLHVHTSEGSIDSALSPVQLVAEAHRIGLTGAVLSEHDGWQGNRFSEFVKSRPDDGLIFIHALEVYTDMGHILTFGLSGYRPGIRNLVELRRVVDEVGGFMILAHPFRYFFPPHGKFSQNVLFDDPKALPADAAAASVHPAFHLVDEVEVVNGANDKSENGFARQVAETLGRPGTGGSDAHSNNGIGRGATMFHGDVRNERDLLDALRAGAYTPIEGFNIGNVTYYGVPPVTVVEDEGVSTSSSIVSVHVEPEKSGDSRGGS